MSRSLTLALLGLALAGTPALAKERDENSGGARLGTRVVSGKPVAQAVPGGGGGGAAAARQAMHWRVAPAQGGRFALGPDDGAASANGACARARGGARGGCRPQPVLGISGWARDLPPPAGVQAEECPSGTMATLARGHEDIIRCMPI